MLDRKLPSFINAGFDDLDDARKSKVKALYVGRQKKTKVGYLFWVLSFLFLGTVPVHCFYLGKWLQALVRMLVPFFLVVCSLFTVVLLFLDVENSPITKFPPIFVAFLAGGHGWLLYVAILFGIPMPFVAWTCFDALFIGRYVEASNADLAETLLRDNEKPMGIEKPTFLGSMV